MTKKAQALSVQSVWAGRLNPRSHLVRELAYQTVQDLAAELWPRFCAKMVYWQHHSALNPITLQASDTQLFPLHRGCSRLVAGVLYQQQMPIQIWCVGCDPHSLMNAVMINAQAVITRRLPNTEQTRIQSFESDIQSLMHSHMDRKTLLEALVPQSGAKKI